MSRPLTRKANWAPSSTRSRRAAHPRNPHPARSRLTRTQQPAVSAAAPETRARVASIAAPLFTRVSSRSLLGGRVGYGRSGWSVYLWGANLLDDQYELALFDGRLFGLPGVYGRMADPRAGAGVDFDW